MRLLPLVLLLLPSLAAADRLLTIPIGRKLPKGVVRLEGAWESRARGEQITYLAAGLNEAVELELRYLQPLDRVAFDLQYNLITPIPDLSPGVSVGVLDAGGITRDGRRVYAAFTLRETFTALDGDGTSDLTFGLFAGRRTRPFVGFSLPLSERVRFLVEHDGDRLSAGAEVRPIRPLALRFYTRRGQNFLTASWTTRF